MYEYPATIDRVVDGDTIDVDIDLGFSIILKKQRVRLLGINAPESRTRDLVEKEKGLAAKAKVHEINLSSSISQSMKALLLFFKLFFGIVTIVISWLR